MNMNSLVFIFEKILTNFWIKNKKKTIDAFYERCVKNEKKLCIAPPLVYSISEYVEPCINYITNN